MLSFLSFRAKILFMQPCMSAVPRKLNHGNAKFLSFTQTFCWILTDELDYHVHLIFHRFFKKFCIIVGCEAAAFFYIYKQLMVIWTHFQSFCGIPHSFKIHDILPFTRFRFILQFWQTIDVLSKQASGTSGFSKISTILSCPTLVWWSWPSLSQSLQFSPQIVSRLWWSRSSFF